MFSNNNAKDWILDYAHRFKRFAQIFFPKKLVTLTENIPIKNLIFSLELKKGFCSQILKIRTDFFSQKLINLAGNIPIQNLILDRN